MRGGQPPLAPKSSHKVLRSFPPPHRLRGKPLKIPPKNLQLSTARHCRTTPPVIAALDAAISFYIVCQVKLDNDKGGNDRTASIARSEATWQSINQRSLPGLLRRFTPRNNGVAKYSVTARLRKKSWQSSDCTNIFWIASLRSQRQCIKKSSGLPRGFFKFRHGWRLILINALLRSKFINLNWDPPF